MEEDQGAKPVKNIKDKKTKNHAGTLLIILFAVLAIAGVGFGIFGMSQAKSKNTDQMKIQIVQEDGTTTEIEAEQIAISDEEDKITITGNPEITPAITPSAENPNDYFYIPEWNIKILKPTVENPTQQLAISSQSYNFVNFYDNNSWYNLSNNLGYSNPSLTMSYYASCGNGGSVYIKDMNLDFDTFTNSLGKNDDTACIMISNVNDNTYRQHFSNPENYSAIKQ